jgi:hypothetical protein
VNVAIPTLEGRIAANPLTPNDPDLLPGQMDIAAPDGPDGEVGAGFVWNSALRAGLSVRNYGFRIDAARYNLADAVGLNFPRLRNPAATKTVIAVAADAALAPYTDPYYRGFDQSFPDYYRFKEWEREFDADYAGLGSAGLPALSLVRLAADHTGNFDAAIDGVNTPELQQADNDYAVGLLVEKIARSKYANDTLVFIIEDDAQDGPDHVDAHRTVALVAGAWVKRGAVVSARFNSVDFLRTIEMVLGLEPLNINDALGQPMAELFTDSPQPWSFTARPSAYLYRTALPIGSAPAGLALPKPTHDAAYWTAATRGMDFSAEDRFDFATYSRILWKGMMGARPYPAIKARPDADDDDDRKR